MTWLEITGIVGMVTTPLSGVVSWIAGTRSRRNSIYQELLNTISTLTQQNSELTRTVINRQDEMVEVKRENADLKTGQAAMISEIKKLQSEVVEVKKENADLRAGQSEMTRQLEMLRRENKELKEIINKK